MSVALVLREIWQELQEVTGNKKIRLKDFMEWRSVEFEGQEGEKVVFLPKLRVWVAYRVEV